jgi:hypothetical protein
MLVPTQCIAHGACMSGPCEKALFHKAFLDVCSFLQTRVAKCTTRDGFWRDSKKPCFTGFFARPADRRTQSRVAGFEALPLCPCRSIAGIEERAETGPPSLAGRCASVLAKKHGRIRVFARRALRLESSRVLHSRLQKLGNVENAICYMEFSPDSAKHLK